MNLLASFLERAEAHSSRTAIIAGDGGRATYGDLIGGSARLAAAWRRKGVGRGDRVLLAMPLGIPLYTSLAALWRLGAVAVFPEPALGLKGLRHAVAATRPRVFLASGWYRGLRTVLPGLWSTQVISPDMTGEGGSDGLEPVEDDHPALISFTSGSTGRPKAIVRSHRFLARQNACLGELLKPTREHEIDLVAFPVFVLADLELGLTALLPGWNLSREAADAAEIAAAIARHGATRALVPPSICEKLAGGSSLSLGAIFTGGGPVFPDLMERLAAKLANADIVSVYGSTEAEPIAYQHMRDTGVADWRAMREGAGLLAGRPIDQIRLEKIADDEIIVTGDHVNKGYLDGADDRTTKVVVDGDIWHRTGDAGHVDGMGRLWLWGRLDGRAGALFPFSVEAAARYWPDVARAALAAIEGKAVLAVEGNARSASLWQREADKIGDVRVVAVRSIPLDRRHRSKVDYPALRTLIARVRPRGS